MQKIDFSGILHAVKTQKVVKICLIVLLVSLSLPQLASAKNYTGRELLTILITKTDVIVWDVKHIFKKVLVAKGNVTLGDEKTDEIKVKGKISNPGTAKVIIKDKLKVTGKVTLVKPLAADQISSTGIVKEILAGSNITLTDNGGGSFTIASTDTDTNTTYSAGSGLSLTGTEFSSVLGASIESSDVTDGSLTSADLAIDSVGASQLASTAIQSGDLPSDGYASTYVNVSGDTMTGALTVPTLTVSTDVSLPSGSVDTTEIADVTRTVPIPLVTWMLNLSAPTAITTGTAPNLMAAATAGGWPAFEWSSGETATANAIVTQFHLPSDYSSGGKLRLFWQAEAASGSTNEAITVGYSAAGQSTDILNATYTTSTGNTIYSSETGLAILQGVDISGSLFANQTISVYIQFSTLDQDFHLLDSWFEYVATN